MREGMTIWHVMGRFVPDQSLPNDPNHIALVEGKYYLGGVEITKEEGSALFEKALAEGRNHTWFQPLRRH